MVQRSGSAPSGNVGFLVMKSGGSIASINGRGGAAFTLNEDTEVFYRIWTDKNNTISNVAYKCSISEGSDSKPWVQGIPDSPSIDYSSEIETVGSNVNLCDNSKILVGVDPKDSSEKDFRTSDYIKVEYGKSYIASLYNEKKVRIGNLVYQEWNKNREKLQQITTDTIKITNQDIAYVTVRNYKNDAEEIKNEFYYKFEESLIATPYSPYGMGSVEIDVVNKNFINKNKISKGLMITATGEMTNSKYFSTDYIKVSKNETYYANEYVPVVAAYDKDKKSIGYIRNTLTGGSFNTGNAVYIRARNNIQLSTEEEIQNAIDKAMIIKGSTSSDYIEHQSQTAIMPIQQEMLEGDYVADVEHHEWGKLVLTGNENFVQAQNANKLNYFYLGFNVVKIKGKIISNMLKSIESGIIWGKTSYDDIVSSASNSKTINIMLSDTTITTLQQFKEKLKELYNAETPIIIYYELATPANLELTVEQKAIRDTKLYTYKNITNIDVSDELASIDVNYKKDPTTEHDELQNQIDEIKQLISTTETSALLLDNLQKDVESEVE